MKSWTDISKKDRFPVGGCLWGCFLQGLRAFFPRKRLRVRCSLAFPFHRPARSNSSPNAIRGPTSQCYRTGRNQVFTTFKYYDHGRPEKKNPAIEQRQAN